MDWGFTDCAVNLAHDTVEIAARSPQVHQEQTLVGNSELHLSSSCITTHHLTSTPKHERHQVSHDSSPSSEAYSAVLTGHHPADSTPVVSTQPQTSYISTQLM